MSVMSKAEAYRVACGHRDKARTPGVRLYWEQVVERMVTGR
jgi:hypothetical protein